MTASRLTSKIRIILYSRHQISHQSPAPDLRPRDTYALAYDRSREGQAGADARGRPAGDGGDTEQEADNIADFGNADRKRTSLAAALGRLPVYRGLPSDPILQIELGNTQGYRQPVQDAIPCPGHEPEVFWRADDARWRIAGGTRAIG